MIPSSASGPASTDTAATAKSPSPACVCVPCRSRRSASSVRTVVCHVGDPPGRSWLRPSCDDERSPPVDPPFHGARPFGAHLGFGGGRHRHLRRPTHEVPGGQPRRRRRGNPYRRRCAFDPALQYWHGVLSGQWFGGGHLDRRCRHRRAWRVGASHPLAGSGLARCTDEALRRCARRTPRRGDRQQGRPPRAPRRCRGRFHRCRVLAGVQCR